MYFKTLEMVGFKSFYNKTILHFEPGVTAIVGPNGCGKSNIFDAIRWVLGEQSIKALRGSQMQDVIFNGTETKEQLGMAEVSLTFDNSKRFFAIDHPEVVITRRLFRSGDSEYFINKNPVRLKDILELLMDTGIGAESYSLIQQGKIDLVLSSRPEDRRLVFDEAAGVSKYKSQKKESLRRLEETEQNLLRINDIIAEVKRQISSLERQANKARRYNEVFQELKNLEVKLALSLRQGLFKQKEQLLNELNSYEVQEKELVKIISEEESRINNRQQDIRSLEDKIMQLKNEILNLENTVQRNNERIQFDKEKIQEAEEATQNLNTQIDKTRKRISINEGRLSDIQNEYSLFEKDMTQKRDCLASNESKLSQLNSQIKNAQDNIASLRRSLVDLAAKIANSKNELNTISSQQQILLARKKRLELEEAKVTEEYKAIEVSLGEIGLSVSGLKDGFDNLCLCIEEKNKQLQSQQDSQAECVSLIAQLEKECLALISHKEFLEQLKTRYETIGEAMNASVYLDRMPEQRLNGLIVKIKEYMPQLPTDTPAGQLGLRGEAKFIDLDTTRITESIKELEGRIAKKKEELKSIDEGIISLKEQIAGLTEERRRLEIELADKRAQQRNIQEQFDKIKGEREIIQFELADIQQGLLDYDKRHKELVSNLGVFENEQRSIEEGIAACQATIVQSNSEKELVVVVITKTKAELEALQERQSSYEETLKILKDQFQQDKDSLVRLETTLADTHKKIQELNAEITKLTEESSAIKDNIQRQNEELLKLQGTYEETSRVAFEAQGKLEQERNQLDKIRNSLHNLSMRLKDIDYQSQALKERLLTGYKVNLEEVSGEVVDDADADVLRQEIEGLKQRLDSYGNVNLVAIEEYDELRQRYDFLVQQQTDLVNAKGSLLEAIQKINRTTKKIFLETFQRLREEFRVYFRMLFNGGDCEIFLLDEQDPLESGIEIVCRPPGKKLQNILLLSGGEKSLAAIALIFAIFKVKPAPFCVLDEIDAALDEANVDRFGRLLTEFTKDSQFIVITHNKKTIANADVMYGITMEESGVSKIVSVKFSQKKTSESRQPEVQAVTDSA